MTDLEKILADDIKNGNIKSFELIFKGYYSRLCKYAYSLVKDYEQASDIVKDFFVKWWQNRELTEINSSISGYLYKSIHNSALNYISRVVPKQKYLSESDLKIPLNELSFPVSEDYPYTQLEEIELTGIIKKAIDKLPEHCREIFILSRVEQYTHEEIARKLGISSNTVKVQIYRALIKLRIDLKDYLPLLSLFF